ncbi:MAG TPA: Ig-like domain-containing protein, partial [Anaerolineae bacterium]|nr:Ig-like domain-containing protein [Anaerolineae bacterium]
MHTHKITKKNFRLIPFSFMLSTLFLTLSLLSLGAVKAENPANGAPPQAAMPPLNEGSDEPPDSRDGTALAFLRHLVGAWKALNHQISAQLAAPRHILPAPNARNVIQRSVATRVVYSDTFESVVNPAHWSFTQTAYYPYHNSMVLGLIGEGTGQADQTISLTLDSLPPHDAIQISFQLFTIGSWDGFNPDQGDAWGFHVQDGPVLLDTTFSAAYGYQQTDWWQNYPDAYLPCQAPSGCISAIHPGHSGASYVYDLDAIYDLAFTFDHTGDAITFDFHGDLGGNLDENWGIDNVVVTAITYKQKVLLVDDDADTPDVRGKYTSTLELLGVHYDVWDVITAGEPLLADLTPYDAVVWFTGAASGSDVGPSSAAEAALDTFLADGKGLLLSSQGYHASRGLTEFMADTLGVSAVTDDAGYTAIQGAGPTLGELHYVGLEFEYENHAAVLFTDTTSSPAFTRWNSADVCGVQKTNIVYSTTFLGFPLDAIPDDCGSRTEILALILNGFAGETLYGRAHPDQDTSSFDLPTERIPADGEHVAEALITLRDEVGMPVSEQLAEVSIYGYDSEYEILKNLQTNENGEIHIYLSWPVPEQVGISAVINYYGVSSENPIYFTNVPVDPDASTVTVPSEVIISECGDVNEVHIEANLVTYAGEPYEGQVDLYFNDELEESLWLENGYWSQNFFRSTPQTINVTLVTYDVYGNPDITLYADHLITLVPGSIDYLNAVELSTDTVLADGASTAVLTLTLRDDYGNPIPDRPLELWLGTANAVGTVNSDADGQVVFDQHLHWRDGIFPVEWLGWNYFVPLYVYDHIYDCHGYMELAIEGLNFIAGPVDLEASHTAISTDTLRIGWDQVEITATLITESGLPYTVEYESGGETELCFDGEPVEGGATDEDGNISFIFGDDYYDWNSWHTPGLVEVSLRTNADSGDVFVPVGTIEFLLGPPTGLALTSNVDAVLADGASQAVLTATVSDDYGNVLPGVSLIITHTAEHLILTQFNPTSDALGQVTATVSSAIVQEAFIYAEAVDYGLTGGQQSIAFIPGPPSTANSPFGVTPRAVPADGVSSAAITATLRDEFGHPIANQTIELHVSGSGNVIAPAASTTSNAQGEVAFTLASTVVETKTLDLYDPRFDASLDLGQVAFVPAPPDPDLSTLVAAPTTVSIDGVTPAIVTVTLRGAENQPLMGQNVTLFLVSGADIALTQPSAPSNIAGQTWGALLTTQAQEVVVGALVAADGVTLTDLVTVTFTPGPVSAVVSTLEGPSGSMRADALDTAPVTVTLRDAFANPIAGHPVSLAVTSGSYTWIDGQAAPESLWLPLGATGPDGVATTIVTSTLAEEKLLGASAGGAVLATSLPLTFVPGPATQLHLLLPGEQHAPGAAPGKSGAPAPTTAGESFTATVLAVDAYWNVAPVAPTVTFTGSDAIATYPPNVALVDGRLDVALTYRTAGEHTLTVSDLAASPLAAVTSTPFTVDAAPAAYLTLALPASPQLISPLDATVTAYDAFDNVASGYAGTLHFTSSDSQATLPDDYTFVAGTDAGAHTFAGGIRFKTPGEQWVQVADAAAPSLSTVVTVTLSDVIVIDTNTTWEDPVVAVQGVVVTNSATLYLDGSSVITADIFTIWAGAAVRADGLGYASGAGPGAGDTGGGPWNQGGGGGHGGWGGAGTGDNPGGVPYGDVYRPSQMGSGGGRSGSHLGGAGGGAIHLVVDALRLDGALSTNGLNAGYGGTVAGGGGAGGSLWIEAQTVTGTGLIHANGGAGGTTGYGNAYGRGGG